MEGIFVKEQPMLPSFGDHNAKLSLSKTAQIFMDIASYHAETLGIGYTGFEKMGLFWVAVKSRIIIVRRANMAEDVIVRTWPEKAGGFKCNRDYQIIANDEVIAYGKTEWGIIDSKDHLPQKAANIYPADLEINPEFCSPEPFHNMKGDFEGELLGTYTVKSVDIDYGKHMNNVAYVRAIESLFSCEELDKRDFTELEIHYKKPCFEKETLSFFQRENEGFTEIKALNEKGEIIILARMR